MEINPRVVLNDHALQAHREHMGTYAIFVNSRDYGPLKRLYRHGSSITGNPKEASIYILGQRDSSP